MSVGARLDRDESPRLTLPRPIPFVGFFVDLDLDEPFPSPPSPYSSSYGGDALVLSSWIMILDASDPPAMAYPGCG